MQGTPRSRLMHPDEGVTRDLGVRLIVADRPGFGLSDPRPGRTLLDWPDDLIALADAVLPGEGHLFLFNRWGEILEDLLSITNTVSPTDS